MEVTMDAIVERCAGLDVHLDTVVACVLYGKLDIKPKKAKFHKSCSILVYDTTSCFKSHS